MANQQRLIQLVQKSHSKGGLTASEKKELDNLVKGKGGTPAKAAPKKAPAKKPTTISPQQAWGVGKFTPAPAKKPAAKTPTTPAKKPPVKPPVIGTPDIVATDLDPWQDKYGQPKNVPGGPASFLGALEGSNREAAVALAFLFKKYGLESLTPVIVDYVKKGYSQDTISLLLQDTKECKERFKGNEVRRAAGLPVLQPSEYLATESAYKQIMGQAGMPPCFYDKPEDFHNWIGKDVAPTEVQERVKAANAVVDTFGTQVWSAFSQYYGVQPGREAMVAYVLDQERALPIVQQQITAAQIGGAATHAGMQRTDQFTAEVLARRGVTAQQAQQAYGAMSGFLKDTESIARLYGEQYDQTTAEQETLFGSGAAAEKRKKLYSQERATFSARGGVGQGGLAGAPPSQA